MTTTLKSSTDTLRHVKPQVRSIAAYTLAARPAAIKINQNENPFDLPESVKRKVVAAALERPWSRYPAFDPTELLERLASFAGWRADGVLAGNGSNELIQALLLVTVGAGARVVIPEPTFTLYALLTKILGGEVVPVSLGPDLQYDAAELRRVRRETEAPLTIVCSPNNPTGGSLARDEIAAMCDEADGLVVVDEAYHEFSKRSAVPLLRDHSNLIVLRTFSKAMAMAGLRVGYLMASPELVREINKARLPYNLNVLSQTAAIAALDDWPELQKTVDRLIAARETLLEALSRIPGVRAFPSDANFILLELLDSEPKPVFEAIYARGVLVRDVSAYPRLASCLRVSVGSEDENAAFLDALGRALQQQRFAKRAR